MSRNALSFKNMNRWYNMRTIIVITSLEDNLTTTKPTHFIQFVHNKMHFWFKFGWKFKFYPIPLQSLSYSRRCNICGFVFIYGCPKTWVLFLSSQLIDCEVVLVWHSESSTTVNFRFKFMLARRITITKPTRGGGELLVHPKTQTFSGIKSYPRIDVDRSDRSSPIGLTAPVPPISPM